MQQTPHALPSAALYQRCDPDSLDFDSTEELEPLKEIPGQQRAIEALRFAAGIDIDGHNVFVLGETGSGRHDFVQQFLGTEAAAQEVPHDWVYVYNFDDPRRPRALALPPGRAVNVRADVRPLRPAGRRRRCLRPLHLPPDTDQRSHQRRRAACTGLRCHRDRPARCQRSGLCAAL